MASTINEIIRESLEKVRAKHLNLTPDNYSKVFCEVAKEKKVVVEDCLKIDKCLERLDKSLQAEAKQHRVRDIDELLQFLVAIVKRSNVAEYQKNLQAFLLLAKRLLQAITMLHDKTAATLANTTIERLEKNAQPQTINLVREKWMEFISSYDDRFLDKLDSFGDVHKDDLQLLVKDVIGLLKGVNNPNVYEAIVPLITASLTPSIASSMNEELAKLSSELRANPSIVSNESVQKEIKSLVVKRIQLDKKEVNERISTLNSLLDTINQKILELIDTSESHNKEVVGIKNDLKSLDISKDSFEAVQAKLLKIVESLEVETSSLTTHMKEDKETIEGLRQKVSSLEVALTEAKKESKEDFLTNVANKRALQSQLERAEETFARYETSYSLCFLDIDNFKNINDTFGHEAGDVILATIGKILNKYVRRVDFVGRYGGEEFLVILPNTGLKEAVVFADKIRKIIENFKFIYKKERIKVEISGGVSERNENETMQGTVESADKQLYKAKENGRNQIQPKI